MQELKDAPLCRQQQLKGDSSGGTATVACTLKCRRRDVTKSGEDAREVASDRKCHP